MNNMTLSRQKGVATLLVTLVFLLIATIAVLGSNRIIYSQQRDTTNVYHSTQANEMAEAAIEFFIAEVQRNRNSYLNASNGLISNNTISNGTPGTNNLHARITGTFIGDSSKAAMLYAAEVSLMKLRLRSIGFSDCSGLTSSSSLADTTAKCGAKIELIQDIDLTQIGLRNALTVQCQMQSTGSTNVLLGWKATPPYPPALSGYAIETGGAENNAGSEYYVNQGDSSKKQNLNPDLCSMNRDDYFKSFFNKTPAQLLDSTKSLRPTDTDFLIAPVKRVSASEFAAACQDPSSFLRDPAKTATVGVVWVDGKIDDPTNGNIILGSSSSSMSNCQAGYDNGAGTINTAKVIFDGNTTIYGSMSITGFMYGRSDGSGWTHSQKGALSIYGAAAFEGSYNGTSLVPGMTLHVAAEEKFINSLGMANGISAAKGNWRDF
ncbi:hypothetical protein [Chitiniphilus shinanonensis]|nr:hypothetical protein [Chitiniphilus shinanonensis]